MIEKDDIERVRAAADLYEIVGSTVSLKASGSGTFVGLCPFHDEKTPSFSIRPSMGVWHCFGCQEGGDVFRYIQKLENVDFPEAVELLADRYRIELHYVHGDDSRSGNQVTRRARLLEANAAAQQYFVSQLSSAEAEPARALLEGRQFTLDHAAQFGCGYAPNSWDSLVRHLATKGFTHQEMIDAGLARMGQRGIYDYFRGRLTWAIRDASGRTLGFGARRLFDDDAVNAKYINTQDTPLYHKNRVLYGLDLAKQDIINKRQLIVVEGYTDVMAFHVAGIKNVVATCGTAFGEEHAKMTRRMVADSAAGALQLAGPGPEGTRRIIFTFDGDAAGQKAAMHAFGLDTLFLSQTFVAVAKDNLDPCDLRLRAGNHALAQLVASAKPLYDFVIDNVLLQFDLSTTTGQIGACNDVLPLIARIREDYTWRTYVSKVARRIGGDQVDLERKVMALRKQLRIHNEVLSHVASPSLSPSSSEHHSALQLASRAGMQSQTALTAQQSSQRVFPPIAQGPAQASGEFYQVSDGVFIKEQQFMMLVIQVPHAVDEVWFNQLSLVNFITPVFKTLYQAIIAVGGLPKRDDPTMTQGLWIHQLMKAGGLMLQSIIPQLAAMPLPVLQDSDTEYQSSQRSSANAGTYVGASSGSRAGDPLREPTDVELQLAAELLAQLLDTGYMRQIALAKRRSMQTHDENEKIQLFGQIANLEQVRKAIQAKIFGNAVG